MIKRNLIANFAGQGWVALMGFLFVPFYLKFIGAEGYGLVGFFVLLSSTAALLDGGLSVTATRQTAAFADGETEGNAANVTLLRTIETLFWLAAGFCGLAVAALAPVIATRWLKVEASRIPEVISGLRFMAATLVVQFPVSFYNGCLIGSQQQVRLNIINSISATVRGVGAVLVLWLVAPTVQAFFAWQCILSLATVLALRVSCWNRLAGSGKVRRFDLSALRSVGRFTAEVGGINVFGFLLTQVDKVMLSKILPLQSFGYYTLAWTLGTLAYRFITPVFNAYYPRLIQLVTAGGTNDFADFQRRPELVGVYLKASRVMAVVVVPFSVWLAFFSHELLALWTRNEAVAQAAGGALTLIALGTMCNGFMHVPYGLQLASGWTRLVLWQNLIAVVLLVPLTYYFGVHYGITGAAAPWLIVNVGYVLISAPLMYNVMLKSAKWNWYRASVLVPFCQAICLVGLFYFLSTRFDSALAVTVVVACGLLTAVAADALSSGLVKTRQS